MPYGPPDTMKYVAATSGSNRILRRADLSAGGIDVNVTKSEGQLSGRHKKKPPQAFDAVRSYKSLRRFLAAF